jgi:cell wall-associated NlpC family hydrolase
MENKNLLKPVLLLGCLLALSLTRCMDSRSIKEDEIRQLINDLGDRRVPDTRTGIFEISVTWNIDEWVLDGITDHPEVMDELLDSLEQKSLPYTNQVKILPGDEMEGKTRGLIRVSVANLRTEPSHTAELCTQGILGMPLKVLQREGGWYRVQTPDSYIGWIDDGGLTLMDMEGLEQYRSEAKIIYTGLWGNSYDQPGAGAMPVSDLVAGSVLQMIEIQGGYYKVKYPDGRLAFVSRSESEPFVEWIDKRDPISTNLVSYAGKLIGIPYLWGGTSVKGVDCSGFTKIVYFMNGLILPRDASQQEDIGMLVDDQKYFSRLLPGDLLFFGSIATDSTAERVVHVGLWIGDMKYLHASGDVHISSMDQNDSGFDQYNYNRYLKTKRILNSQFIDQIFIRKFY